MARPRVLFCRTWKTTTYISKAVSRLRPRAACMRAIFFRRLWRGLWRSLRAATMVLRVEDLDRERSKPQFIDAVQRDFETLGLTWDEGPYFQHNRDEAYQAAFDSLVERGLVYPCFCTRADLHAASAPHHGEKLVYAGTCRALTAEQRAEKAAVRKPAMRLVVPDETIAIDDLIQGHFEQNLAHDCGDFLIRRSDEAFAYQLAVVVDDGEQGVNSVVRGMDLLCSSPQQRYLQDLLGLSHAQYAHVPLVVGERDRRLSACDHDAGALGMPMSALKPPRRLSATSRTSRAWLLRATPQLPKSYCRHSTWVACGISFPTSFRFSGDRA